MSEFVIGGRAVGGDHPAFLVAEAGFNHNGSLDLALELVDAAAAAGADAIKFQSFTPDRLVHPSVSYFPIFRDAVLDEAAHGRIAERASARGIAFGSTPFDPHWVDVLDSLHADYLKVASMDLTNPQLLDAVAATGRPVLLSTGLATLSEVRAGVDRLASRGAGPVAVLHCISLYPTPRDRANLRAIRTLSAALGIPAGFSDHTLGDDVTALAVAAGASVIEKHFTLDCSLPGADHAHSLDPAAFSAMVRRVREVEESLGDGRKEPCAEELPLIDATRRGLAVGRSFRSGERVDLDQLVPLRPRPLPSGLRASDRELYAGRTATRDLAELELLSEGDLE